MLGLFKETYPLYPQEPLLLLIKSGVFIGGIYGGDCSARNCFEKLALFMLLASKSESKDFEWLSRKIVYKTVTTTEIQKMFEICIGMLKSLHKTRHVGVELLTDQDYKILKKLAESKAKDIAK